ATYVSGGATAQSTASLVSLFTPGARQN
nr:envelope protein 2 variant 1011 [Hepacivirus hominis]MOY47676.1 envelope protein 2 variant 1108 [Hepacivirus hominis]MOY47774.1 envelope protein 2 variant 1206 [Hepacivirus hominis]MOY47792.1 envelope protein 2 variant 1224 [Hepacivirus hominis]MOY47809.1 envelope protein 2 variant 1241 [Hepacivirus hominis]